MTDKVEQVTVPAEVAAAEATVIDTTAQADPVQEVVAPVRRVNRELASIGVRINEEAPAELLGPTRTMTLKGAKEAAIKESNSKAVNQQVLEKARLKEHLEGLSKRRQIN